MCDHLLGHLLLLLCYCFNNCKRTCWVWAGTHSGSWGSLLFSNARMSCRRYLLSMKVKRRALFLFLAFCLLISHSSISWPEHSADNCTLSRTVEVRRIFIRLLCNRKGPILNGWRASWFLCRLLPSIYPCSQQVCLFSALISMFVWKSVNLRRSQWNRHSPWPQEAYSLVREKDIYTRVKYTLEKYCL